MGSLFENYSFQVRLDMMKASFYLGNGSHELGKRPIFKNGKRLRKFFFMEFYGQIPEFRLRKSEISFINRFIKKNYRENEKISQI